jgi:hypothetical protein
MTAPVYLWPEDWQWARAFLEREIKNIIVFLTSATDQAGSVARLLPDTQSGPGLEARRAKKIHPVSTD